MTTTLLQNVYRTEVKSTSILVVNEHAVTDTAERQSYGNKQILWKRRLTDSSAVGLQSHAAVLLLQELVAEEDPGRVVCLVQPDGTAKICNGLIMVTSKAVEVACTIVYKNGVGVCWSAE